MKSGVYEIPDNPTDGFPPYLTYEQMNLINQFRYLTTELAIWTRELVEDLKFNTGGVDEIYAKLHAVPVDIYEAMTTFYGAAAAEEFLNYLRQHVILVRSMTEALLANDTRTANELMRRWYFNADQTANFFAGLSPYWSTQQWRYLLYQYIQLIYAEILAFIQGNYQQSIQIFDRTLYHSTLLADYASKGLIQNLQQVPTSS